VDAKELQRYYTKLLKTTFGRNDLYENALAVNTNNPNDGDPWVIAAQWKPGDIGYTASSITGDALQRWENAFSSDSETTRYNELKTTGPADDRDINSLQMGFMYLYRMIEDKDELKRHFYGRILLDRVTCWRGEIFLLEYVCHQPDLGAWRIAFGNSERECHNGLLTILDRMEDMKGRAYMDGLKRFESNPRGPQNE
jgi:hypothetical protein